MIISKGKLSSLSTLINRRTIKTSTKCNSKIPKIRNSQILKTCNSKILKKWNSQIPKIYNSHILKKLIHNY